MSAVRLATVELRRMLAGRLPRLALLAAALVPLLYGALYLWAFWDPTGRLDRLPAALVVEDVGAVADGQPVRLGERLQAQLLEDGSFAWQVVDAGQARAGLREGTYALTMTVPADFSSRLADPGGADAGPATLRLRTDDSMNYLASSIARTAATAVEAAVEDDVVAGYLDQIFLQVADAAAGGERAAAGAQQLADGLDRAGTGSTSLAGGLVGLSSGATRLEAGVTGLRAGGTRLEGGADRLAEGTAALSAGLVRLRDGTAELPVTTAALAAGAEQVADGTARNAAALGQAGTGVDRSAADAAAVRRALANFVAANPGAGADPDLQAALTRADGLADGLTVLRDQLEGAGPRARSLAAGAGAVAAGTHALADSAPDVAAGLAQSARAGQQVAAGATELSAGSQRMSAGLAETATGAARLAAGSREASAGAAALDSGLVPLRDGGTALAAALSAGAQDVPVLSDQERRRRTATLSDPVRLDEQMLNAAPTYGTGFASYFVPLALWVGGILVFMLLRPISHRGLAAEAPGWRLALAGWLPAAAIGAVQVVVLLAVLRFGVGLQPERPLLLLAFTVLVAAVFAALLQLVHARFGSPGRLLALVLLMLQLTSSGGTFPVETTPSFLQAISPALPMTYAVRGIRHLVLGGDLSLVARSAGVLVAFGAAALLLTALTARRRRTWTTAHLHPQLALA